MIRCPGCKALHPLNTLYCDECGECLLGDGSESEATPGSLSGSTTSREAGGDGREIADQCEASNDGPAVTLVIGDAGDRICFPLDEEILLGRPDQEKKNHPDVDLSQYGGLQAGVSRRHARIYREGGDVVVEDLGSINGSFLNGEQLLPYLAYTLGNGDELRFGNMRIAVVI